MTSVQCSVSDFKARCTVLLRELELHPQRIEVTNRGRIVAVVMPPEPDRPLEPADWLGSLRGSVLAFEGPTLPAGRPQEWSVLQTD